MNVIINFNFIRPIRKYWFKWKEFYRNGIQIRIRKNIPVMSFIHNDINSIIFGKSETMEVNRKKFIFNLKIYLPYY